ncbi:hypothetical protein [Pseudofrankia inefficax]|uniref:hypothetical protein n=1 Tax=Pseudofrankia inefficax (strain DSM 45817 / CECT 9037 / DDB 130130 / EuI1c) TaxID=298654 RepID=UPI001E591496|nr:hypothetical protein [Pseudofrankia inefficax]
MTIGVSLTLGILIGREALGKSSGSQNRERSALPTATSQPTPPATAVTVVPSATSDGADNTAEPAGALPGAPSHVNEFGIPVGYPHTEPGAISACGNYVSAYSDVRNREPSRIRAVLGSIATSSASKTISDQIIKADDANAKAAGANSISDPGLNFNLRVVGFSAKDSTANSATVSIWSVGGIGMYSNTDITAAPREVWGSDDCTVTWTNGDWKLSAATDGPDGPAITQRPGEDFRRFFYIGGPSA